MSGLPDYLPKNATLFERSLTRNVNDEIAVAIRDVVDPLRAPLSFIPFLAAHESVDLWYDDWSEARKRQMIAKAPVLAKLKGTREGSIKFMEFVDAELLDTISYPARFIFGKAVIGRTPIGHQPWVARYLVKIETSKAPRSFVIGRSAFGNQRIKTPSREPFKRAMAALRASKAPETQYRIDFGHKRPLVLTDQPLLSDGLPLGGFVARNKF